VNPIKPSAVRAIVLSCLALPVGAGLAWAGSSQPYEKLAADVAPVLVTVKFVLKLGGRFGDSENESEITGMMVDPKGLVLCASSKLGVPRRFGSATPTDIKILVGDDTEGLEADVLARDTELDLAWVKIKKPPEKSFLHLDMTKTAEPKLGDALFSVRRMAKFFDRTPTVSDGVLAGRTKKPRDLLVPGGALNIEPGAPVFTSDGAFVGLVVLQLPEDEEMEGNPMAFFAMGRDLANGLILPAAQVVKATQRAGQIAEDEEDEDEGDETPAAKGADAKHDTKNGDENDDDDDDD